MTYRQLTEKIQDWLRRHSTIKGYASQQEKMAEKPCYEVLRKCGVSDILYLAPSTGAGIFYDIYANIAETKIHIGYFENNGTIRRQPVQAKFFYINEHGDKEFQTGLRDIAKEKLQEKSNHLLSEIETLKEKLKNTETKWNNIQQTIKQLST